VVELDAATFARVIREQSALPLTEAEADTLAAGLENVSSDEEFLAKAVAAVRLLAERLEPPPHAAAEEDKHRGGDDSCADACGD
jgi:hypothetical protein